MPREIQSSPEQLTAQKETFAKTLLRLLDEPLYELLRVSHQELELYESRLTEKQRKKLGSKVAISGVLAELEKLLYWQSLSRETQDLITQGSQGVRSTESIRHSIQVKDSVDHEDIHATLALVVAVLKSLYPDKSVHEIRTTFKKVHKKEKSSDHEKEELLQREKRRLYAAYFQWGYYPGVKERLHLTGDKTEDEAIIEKKEKELHTKVLKGRDLYDALADIREHIAVGRVSANEKLFYLLETNKLRGHWFESLAGPIELLVDFAGIDIPEEIVDKVHQLIARVKKKRTFVSESQEAEAEEQGYDIRESTIQEDVSEEDIKEGNTYIEIAISRLYPDAVSTDGKGNIMIDRAKLEHALGLPSTPEAFIAFMRENAKL